MASAGRLPALAGAVAPFLFLATLVLASRVESDYMASFDWGIWPAGLALGPEGWLWPAACVILGVLVILFGSAIIRRGPNRRARVAGFLFALAGVCALMFALKTDLNMIDGHAETGNPLTSTTMRGFVHAIGFTLFVPLMLVGAIVLWRAVRREADWRTTRRWGFAGLLLLLPALALPSLVPIGGYAVLVVIMGPLTVVGARLAAMQHPTAPTKLDT